MKNVVWGQPFEAAAELRPGVSRLGIDRDATRKRGGSLKRLTPRASSTERLVCLLLLVLTPVLAAPETICTLGTGAASYKPASDQRPSPDAMQIAGRVNTAVKSICGQNCPTMALFRNASTPNMMLINDAGQAKIVYSPQFLATAYDRYGDLGILAIIAHELGHALDATLGAKWVNEKWTPELRADGWAGCILAHVDSGASGFAPALEALSSYPSPTHPNWTQRLPVIRAGFAGCGGDAAKLQKK